MKSNWFLILVAPLALLGAWVGISHDSREQTVFLERIAGEVERARTIPPETEHAIQETVASIRWRALPVDERLDARQRRAIERIEARLSLHNEAISQNDAIRPGRDTVSRRLPRGIPYEE